MMELTLNDRCDYFDNIFEELQDTNSIVEKREIINKIPKELKDDFMYILECLNGKHKFGFTYYYSNYMYNPRIIDDNWTIKQVLQYLQTPIMDHDLSQTNIDKFVKETSNWCFFLEPIVNRTLKLGIGNSLFEKKQTSPMLAKKYEGILKPSKNGYYITEKLDGNRCIAQYYNDEWHFISRNGKEMHVNFDMGILDKDYIYDGEVLSRKQVEMSKAIYDYISFGVKPNKFSNEFNSTSGLINQHNKDKDLVYNIFDIISDEPYRTRHSMLRELNGYNEFVSDNVRILPILASYDAKTFNERIYDLLDKVTSVGGEGVMINIGDAPYEQKRTDVLLKLKKVQTMDMQVTYTNDGTGKYEGLVGSLHCEVITDDRKFISCDVGSGLSDEQRYEWSVEPWKIVGKIVEIAYFSISQSKTSNDYSLRFPRLKKIRDDKSETSEY